MAHPPQQERAHATPLTYVQIAGVLLVITLTEVGVFYVEALRGVLAPVLLTLSATKFALVAMFYMHLKYDSRLFTGVFVAGLLVASLLVSSFILLMRAHG